MVVTVEPASSAVAVEKDDDGPSILAVSLSYDNVVMISLKPSITIHLVAGASYF